MKRFLHRIIQWPSIEDSRKGTGPVLFSFPLYRADGRRHLEVRGRAFRGQRGQVNLMSILIILGIIVLLGIIILWIISH